MKKERIVNSNRLGYSLFDGAKDYVRDVNFTGFPGVEFVDDEYYLEKILDFHKGKEIYLDNPNYRNHNCVLGGEVRISIDERNEDYTDYFEDSVGRQDHLCEFIREDVIQINIDAQDVTVELSPGLIHFLDKMS